MLMLILSNALLLLVVGALLLSRKRRLDRHAIASKNGAWRRLRHRGLVSASRKGSGGTDGDRSDHDDRITGHIEGAGADERYHLLALHGRDAICVHDSDGRIEYASPAIKTLLGYGPDELKERSLYVLIHEDDRQRVRSKIETRVREDGESILLRYRIRSKKGTYVPVETICRPHLDEKGYATKFVTSTRDITETRRLKRRLRKIEKELAEARGFDGEVVRIMSHELRTPLTGIVGVMDVLNDEIAGENRKMLELARKSVDRMLDTFTSIMDLSTLDANPASQEGGPVDAVKIVGGEVARYRKKAGEKGVTIQLVKEHDVIEAELDPGALARITDQLLSNAVKFTPEGGVVTVAVMEDEDAVVARVSDTGIGISPAFLPHIYEPFRQESTGLSREHEGVGIGLSIVRRLTDQMNGDIRVDSVKGKGTTFTVRLPRLRRPVSEQQPAPVETREAGDSESAGESTPDRRLRILAVDDNEPMRLVMRRYLEADFAVVTAGDGDSAIELAADEDFDVIILDMNLGRGKSGQDVLEEVRRLPGGEDIFVIAVTAYALPEERSRFLRIGFDGYVSKPFSRETLLREISRLTMVPVEIRPMNQPGTARPPSSSARTWSSLHTSAEEEPAMAQMPV